jgi:hypothetical protein
MRQEFSNNSFKLSLFYLKLGVPTRFSQAGAKDGTDKEQAFHPDFTDTLNNRHVPPR